MTLSTKTIGLGLLAAGLLALWLGNGPDASPVLPKPTDEWARTVEPIRATLAKAPERKRLGLFYAAFADVVARDGQAADKATLTTVADLVALNERAGKLAFQQTGVQGKYPGLAKQIDDALRVGWGDNAPLDAAKRARAVECLRAVAWACGG